MALPEFAYHLLDGENWPLHDGGLLPASMLVSDDGAYRPALLRSPSGVVLRDQAPMPPSALQRCLDQGLTPEDWYQLVNRHVYFWLDGERLRRHRRACGQRPQILLTIDLAALLRLHGAQAFLTPFNVGSARRLPARRGARSFVPLESWRTTRWDSEAAAGRAPRARSHPPAELAIRGAVPEIETLIVDMHQLNETAT